MLYTDQEPTIKVEKTISDPDDPITVLGFEARDPVMGYDITLLKEDSLPEVGEEEGDYKIPFDVAQDAKNVLGILVDDGLLLSDNYWVRVVSDDYVTVDEAEFTLTKNPEIK